MDSLSSIPVLNKAQFISSFISSQKANAKAYAEEGKAFAFSWKSDEGSISKPTRSSGSRHQEFGFATPVLKSRELKRAADTRPKVDEGNPLTETGPTSVLKPRKPSPKEKRPGDPEAKKEPQRTNKKRHAGVEDEIKEDHLEERRLRKRAKREAVKPMSEETEGQSSEEELKLRKTKTTGKTKRNTDIPPGLALMHGFSATNVGNSRLTVLPRIVGVFNKGKASARVGVQRKSSSGKDRSLSFLETEFLNKCTKQNKSVPSAMKRLFQASESDSEAHEEDDNRTSSKLSSQPARKSSSSSETSPSRPEAEAKRIESEIWDIELDEVVLPSLPSAVSHSRSDLVFDTRKSAWIRQIENSPPMLEQAGPEPSPVKIADDYCRPSSSIAPSQSASQCRAPHLIMKSKYFEISLANKCLDRTPNLHQHLPPIDPASPDKSSRIISVTLPIHTQINLDQDNSAASVFELPPFIPLPDQPATNEQGPRHMAVRHPAACSERPLTPYFTDVDYVYAEYSAPIWVGHTLSVREESWGIEETDDFQASEILYEMQPSQETCEWGLDTQMPSCQVFGLTQANYNFHDAAAATADSRQSPDVYTDIAYETQEEEEAEDEMYGGASVIMPGDDREIDIEGSVVEYEDEDTLDTGGGLLGVCRGSCYPGFRAEDMNFPSLAAAEADVVFGLRGHWQPQRL
ncbi:hypothetical protein Moror_17504 [Moniliophthora roreri MCA 2997]|uniref:Uncharacterized protein n=2 Tax=Moniliophthora roreri TaxID=221103 RepID=V2XV69_MONRO|nr:hypothetical protein Moror_17504 [Moniliophthora roreri MCA 2997]